MDRGWLKGGSGRGKTMVGLRPGPGCGLEDRSQRTGSFQMCCDRPLHETILERMSGHMAGWLCCSIAVSDRPRWACSPQDAGEPGVARRSRVLAAGNVWSGLGWEWNSPAPGGRPFSLLALRWLLAGRLVACTSTPGAGRISFLSCFPSSGLNHLLCSPRDSSSLKLR